MRDSSSDRRLGAVVVEDNDFIRAMEADILTGQGYRVATAAVAEMALSLLDEPSVQLLVTDIRLPGAIDGIALARLAKRRRPDLRILVVGAALEQLAPEDLVGIADGYLAKPFTVCDFEEQMAIALEPKQTRQ
jgi:DNA-binding NtrC family response regulator